MSTAINETDTTLAPRQRDSDLLRLYTEQRSESAFAELSRRYTRLIYATCLRETRLPTLAEDATQGVFLLMSQKAGSLQRVDSLAAWLYTASRYISRNLLKQELRRQMNEARALEESLPSADPGNPLWEQIEPHFHAALDRLKPADRAAILLRYVQDESLAEVGACLGIPENTARMRINRAMEKIRTHLAQVGIAVTLALLATLLEEQAARATPVALLTSLTSAPRTVPASLPKTISTAVRRTSRLLLLLTLRFPLFLLLVASVLFGSVALVRSRQPQRLTLAEQQQLFLTLRGNWTGTLDFADDRTHQHFTLPSTVVFTLPAPQSALRFTATYTGSDREDITTLTGDPRTGAFVADNGGPRNSHTLHSDGELVKLSPSEFAFQGWSPRQNADVRLRLTLRPNQITLSEEYRKQGQSTYRFRNRFALHR